MSQTGGTACLRPSSTFVERVQAVLPVRGDLRLAPASLGPSHLREPWSLQGVEPFNRGQTNVTNVTEPPDELGQSVVVRSNHRGLA
jgi:hypothetical protein